MGEPVQHTYSAAELRWLKRHRPRLPIGAMGPRFRARFGVTVSDCALAATCQRHGIAAGRDGRFQPGSVPWNTGLPTDTGRETQFKPGHPPANQRTVGEYAQDPNGRWKLKVRDTHGKGVTRRNWAYVTHLTWAAHHGPVPAGHVVMVLDGNEDACLDIDNLACIPRGVLARANQDGYADLPPERTLRRAVLAAAALRQAAWDAARAAGLTLYEQRKLLSPPRQPTTAPSGS